MYKAINKGSKHTSLFLQLLKKVFYCLMILNKEEYKPPIYLYNIFKIIHINVCYS